MLLAAVSIPSEERAKLQKLQFRKSRWLCLCRHTTSASVPTSISVYQKRNTPSHATQAIHSRVCKAITENFGVHFLSSSAFVALLNTWANSKFFGNPDGPSAISQQSTLAFSSPKDSRAKYRYGEEVKAVSQKSNGPEVKPEEDEENADVVEMETDVKSEPGLLTDGQSTRSGENIILETPAGATAPSIKDETGLWQLQCKMRR